MLSLQRMVRSVCGCGGGSREERSVCGCGGSRGMCVGVMGVGRRGVCVGVMGGEECLWV